MRNVKKKIEEKLSQKKTNQNKIKQFIKTKTTIKVSKTNEKEQRQYKILLNSSNISESSNQNQKNDFFEDNNKKTNEFPNTEKEIFFKSEKSDHKENIRKRKLEILISNIKILILINLFIQVLADNKIDFNKYYLSKIKLKIKGTGIRHIFCPRQGDFENSSYPDEVYINYKKQGIINASYYFNENDNLVELIWNNSFDYCKFMFYQCYDITEIDLSDFNTSQCTGMQYMFRNCSSLVSINLDNIDTSKVVEVFDMFAF